MGHLSSNAGFCLICGLTLQWQSMKSPASLSVRLFVPVRARIRAILRVSTILGDWAPVNWLMRVRSTSETRVLIDICIDGWLVRVRLRLCAQQINAQKRTRERERTNCRWPCVQAACERGCFLLHMQMVDKIRYRQTLYWRRQVNRADVDTFSFFLFCNVERV